MRVEILVKLVDVNRGAGDDGSARVHYRRASRHAERHGLVHGHVHNDAVHRKLPVEFLRHVGVRQVAGVVLGVRPPKDEVAGAVSGAIAGAFETRLFIG